MNPRELKNEIVELRMTEMEVREQLTVHLSELNTNKLWKEIGRTSLADFCMKDLGYDRIETRDVMVRLGLVLSSSQLASENPAAQVRIERLKAWRRQRASRDGVAAYFVLSNRSLLDVAERNPGTLDELKWVKGIGEKKCEAYGNEILTVLTTAAAIDQPLGSFAVVSREFGSSPSASVHNP